MPDTITLTERHDTDVRSTGADVILRVAETGIGARTSQRAAKLRARLGARGFGEDEIALQGVDHTRWAWIALPFFFLSPLVTLFGGARLDAGLGAAGAFLALYLALRAARLGTVTATLQVRCSGRARVGVAVDEALAFGAEVAGIVWRYDVDAAAQTDWAVDCVARANARAARLAEALGVQIAGVHAYEEASALPPVTQVTPDVPMRAAAAQKGRVGTLSESVGAEGGGTARAGLRVTIAYRVKRGGADGAGSAVTPEAQGPQPSV